MLDVGHAWDEYFLNSVGIGFDAEVAAEVARGGTLSGIPAYLVAVIRVLRGFLSPTLTCRAAEASFTERFLLIEIGVGPVVGGGFRITPDARPDDGVFDVCAIRHQTTFGILTKLPLAMFGWHTRLAAVRSFRTASLAISGTDGPLRAQMDGELRSLRSEMTITLKPLALPVLVTA
jgi:diacylglycerol kinase family enzyme